MSYKLRYIFAIIILCCLSGAHAETVSQKEASRFAHTFFNALYGEVTAPPKMVWNGRQLTTARLFAPFYVYNSPKGGFVIVSAENKAFPVLAYSKDATFRREALGEDETAKLRQFAREIELVRYDSTVPAEAISAWRNQVRYIAGLIENPYAGRMASISDKEREEIELIDRRNSWIIMPSALEYTIYDPDQYREATLDDALGEEEIPFAFYEDFIKLIEKESEERQLAFNRKIEPDQASVRPLGGGHYEIFIPEGAAMMRLYNLQGGMNIEKYYDHLSTLNINIEHMPPGFYIGLVLGDDGKIYSFKLHR